MKKAKFKIAGLVLVAFLALYPQKAEAICTVEPTQLMTSLLKLCWGCMLPISLAGVQVAQGPMPDPLGSFGSPVCFCPFPPPIFVRPGVPFSYFEATRMIDSVKDPFCFVGLGISMPELVSSMKGTKGDGNDRQRTYFQSHYYIYPVLEVLGVFIDVLCLSMGSGLDIGYITEVDPLWQDDQLSALISPEALLFANPVSNLACIADSISAQANVALDPLFWCKGSWGNAYPLTGNTNTKDYVEDAASVASTMIYKMHRQLLLWGSFGQAGLCSEFPMPIWKKGAYRLQIIAPIPHPIGMAIGQSGILWSFAKNLPSGGDNFSFILFRKKECCML